MLKQLPFKSFLLLALLSILLACQDKKVEILDLTPLNDSIKKVFAPDKRVAIYNVDFIYEDPKNSYLLKGETSIPEAKEALLTELKKFGVLFQDQIKLLPDESVGEYQYAVVRNSVANIRSKPKHSGELATQALMGMTLKVLKIDGDFYLVQTPDQYISWVDHGGVQLMNEQAYKNWQIAEKIIYTNSYGQIYQSAKAEKIVSDIVMGALVKLEKSTPKGYEITLPDGRLGFIKRAEAESFSKWKGYIKPSQALIEAYANNLMGSPYLWGGTSTKGMDCSGFTKTIYLLNGLIIPRDASQQIMAGKIVDENKNFENLQKGDLLFFGTAATEDKKQRVTHVALWLGNGKGEFIHAAGRVRMSSIYPDSPFYDKANVERYLGSRRYLGVKDPLITPLYQEEETVLAH